MHFAFHLVTRAFEVLFSVVDLFTVHIILMSIIVGAWFDFIIHQVLLFEYCMWNLHHWHVNLSLFTYM